MLLTQTFQFCFFVTALIDVVTGCSDYIICAAVTALLDISEITSVTYRDRIRERRIPDCNRAECARKRNRG